MRLWPFRKQHKTETTPAPWIGQQADTTQKSSVNTPIKVQAMLYLDATLAVLKREGVPLATPVHGKPARGARFVEIPVHLDRRRVGPMAMRKIFNSGTITAIQAAAQVDGLNIWQERNAIVYQYQLDKALWRYYKRTDLPSSDGIGLGVGRRLIPFVLDDKNTLVAGETRSGKSVTIESILFALMSTYTQAEMGLIIIDPNQTMGIRKVGLKATEVGSFTNAAHLLRPVAYNRQQIEEAIDYVYQEWKHRMQNGIQDAPAIVLVIDELMSDMVIGDKEARSHNEEHLAKMSQLASQGIKNNIFLVIGAQDPKVGNTSGLLMRNLGLRFIGHVTDDNASRTLAGRSGVNAHLLTGNGDFVQVSDDTLLRFQVAEPTRDDFDRLERRAVQGEPVRRVDIINVPEHHPEADEADLDPTLLISPEMDSGGRKEVCVDPQTLALYFYEKKLSIGEARERYGILRKIHTQHRDFALALTNEIKLLQSGHRSQSPYYLKKLNDEEPHG
ncbi:MAG: FtsK/SpoIIIE domain-containing protein [Chloroflexota bacterium]